MSNLTVGRKYDVFFKDTKRAEGIEFVAKMDNHAIFWGISTEIDYPHAQEFSINGTFTFKEV